METTTKTCQRTSKKKRTSIPIPNLNQDFITALYISRIVKASEQAYPSSSSEEKPLPKQDFEKVLLEAVDESLSSLGESSKQAIYYHLDKSFNIKRPEIPCNVDAFVNALGKIFGPGADFIETLIMKRLNEKIESNQERHTFNELNLAQLVTTAKQSFREKEEDERTEVEVVQCEDPTIES